ncbi:MAG: diguanylate cyclase [Acidobacteria bacterium]|nr:diguanylate cyclase [Acidobacteriota bacterium]
MNRAVLTGSFVVLLVAWCIAGKEFEHLGSAQGLSHGITYGCVQDFRGFIWIATENGLDCWDGYRFSPYQADPDNPDSPSENNIGVILHSREGEIWFGTWGGGVNRLNLGTGRFAVYRNRPGDPSSLGDDRVQALHQDRTGTIWVGTYSRGLSRFEPTSGTFRHFDSRAAAPGRLSHDRVWSIAEAPDGTLWVGTGNGLNRLDPSTGRIVSYFHDPANPRSIPHAVVRKVFFDRAGRLWIGTEAGLGLFEPAAGAYLPLPLASPAGPDTVIRVNTLLEDPSGNLWIGTSGMGLFRYTFTGGAVEHFTYDPADPRGLSHNDIRSLFVDRSQNLWVCTRGGGINLLDLKPERFRKVTYNPRNPSGLSDGNVRNLYLDRGGTLWVGTEDGLNRSADDGQSFVHFKPREGDGASISYNRVRAVCEGRDGTVWVATLGGGLNALDPVTGKFRRFRSNPAAAGSLSHDRVNAVLVDSSGTVWAGTDEGLNRLNPDGQTFTRYLADPGRPGSLSGNYVTALFQDRSGTIFVGTEKGLNLMDSKTGDFRVYLNREGDPASLSHDRVTCFQEDPRGAVWVGTMGGLNRFDPETGTFFRYSQGDGLPCSHIAGILFDRAGNLWVSTAQGLARLSRAGGRFRAYDVNDGLPGNEFFDGSCMATADGRLWFGCTKGLIVFNPDRVRDNPNVPPVVLTSFSLFDKEVHSGLRLQGIRELDIPWQNNFFSFEFAALDFTRPSKNLYAYKLEGFDADWVQCGNRRFASYTNLDGGEYVFTVKGSNNDGVWNEKGVSIRIRVQTKPWKTWWAYLLYALAGIGLVWAWAAFRTRAHRREITRQRLLVENLRRVDELKDEFLTNTSHELRAPINGMIGIVDGLLGGAAGPLSAQANGSLTLVSYSARRLFHMVQDILDFSKLRNRDITITPKPLDLQQVAEVVRFLCRPLFIGKNVTLSNTVHSDLPAVDADEIRLQQILVRLVENAAKHTECGAVTLSAELRGVQVEVSVTDTGKGIPPSRVDELQRFFSTPDAEVPPNALGLGITRYLVDLHGGRMSLESTPGKGSRFRFTLPVSRSEGERGSGISAATEFVEQLPAADAALLDVVLPTTDIPADAFRVLVVDDEVVTLQVLVHQLTLLRFAVTPVRNGVEALERVAMGEEFDLVITDTVMPRMSGFELCRKLREKYSMFEVPVIMLTEKNQPREILAGFEAGANDYLAKPFDRKEMESRVRTLLSLKQAVQRAIVNARHLESEHQQRVLAETLRDMTRALTSTLNTQEVLTRLLENMRYFVRFESGLALYREEGMNFRALAAFGEPLPREGEALSSALLNTAAMKTVTETRQLLRVDDLADSPRFRDGIDPGEVRSLLGVPLLCRGELQGIIVLKSTVPGAFSGVEADMAFTVAGQAGIAVENSKMFTEIKRMAVTDALTGLTNRRHFFDLAEAEFQRSRRYERPLAVIMADIDHFKQVNDTWGHSAGDEALREVAGRFQSGIRRVDLVGRYGGEEFVFLLPESDLDAAMAVAERIRVSVAEPAVTLSTGEALRLTVSLGVAALREGIASLQQLLDVADGALFVSKHSGRDRVTAAEGGESGEDAGSAE